jgi:ATP-binding cassette, subfamily B, bacterial
LTSSLDGKATRDEALPSAIGSMWRLVALGYRSEPRLLVYSFGLTLLAALPDALLALWIALLGKGAVDGDRTLLLVAAAGLGLSATATWFLRTVSTRVSRTFRDKVTVALEAHVAKLQASVATIEHHERPDYLDRLSVLREQVFVLDHMYLSLFTTCGWILRLGVTVVLLAAIDPVLVLLALFAAPTVLTSSWRPGVERAVEERGAPSARLARHLFVTTTTAPPGKELRVTGTGRQLADRRREAWEGWHRPIARARWASAAWHTAA